MSQLTRITTSHDKLEKEVTELGYNSTVIGGELSEQRDNITIIQRQLSVFGKEFNILQNQNIIMKEDIIIVRSSFEGMKEELTVLLHNNTATVEELAGLKRTNEDMKEELTILKNKTTDMTEGLTLFTHKLLAMNEELSREKHKNAALEEKLTKILQQNSVLETQMNNFSQKFDSIERVLNSHATCRRGQTSIVGDRKLIILGMKVAMCDTVTDGGGWIIIQRRTKGDVDFYRGWSDYKKGFGTPDTDFWIGNDVIHNLTSRGYTELRIDLEYKGSKYFAHYSNFNVGDEVSKYKLSVSGYSGTANDSLAYHDGMKFSTFDQDNDLDSWNCADVIGGAWWYNLCFFESSINGKWGRDGRGGVVWSGVIYNTFVSSTEMKMRHV